jgi:uncharacterized protein (DUF1697 family)
MPRYVAFLRAINVGAHIVKMERLCALFEELGFANVETFIASGNVIFESRAKSALALERKIEAHLLEALGYEVMTVVRTDNEVAAIAAHRPFPEAETAAEGAAVYIAFLAAPPNPEAAATLLAHRGAVDEFKIQGREIYWLCRTRFSESAFSGARLEKMLGARTTVRNSSTIRKIAAKYPPRV